MTTPLVVGQRGPVVRSSTIKTVSLSSTGNKHAASWLWSFRLFFRGTANLRCIIATSFKRINKGSVDKTDPLCVFVFFSYQFLWARKMIRTSHAIIRCELDSESETNEYI